MNTATIITVIVLVIVTGIAVYKTIENKKRGRCSCGCDMCPSRENCQKRTS